MRAVSAKALEDAKKQLGCEFDAKEPRDIYALAEQFMVLSDTIDSMPKLGEALISTMRSPEDKEHLLHTIFAKQLHPLVYSVLMQLSQRSWSTVDDFSTACQELGLFAVVFAAKKQGELREVQEELFSIDKTLRSHRELRAALIGKNRSIEDRVKLARSVFSSVISERTLMLFQRVIERASSGRIITAVRRLRHLTAQAQGKELAVVETAKPIDLDQKERLERILQKKNGCPVHIDYEINPELIGGIRIRQGARLFEGTLGALIQSLKTTLAG